MKFSNDQIPPVFYSDLQAKPLENCVMCGKDVLHSNEVYMIEKVIKNGRSESEYAICFTCASKMKGNMSVESEANLAAYFESNPRLKSMQDFYEGEEEVAVDDLLKCCLIKGTPVSELDEYQLGGVFKGDKLYPAALPFVLSLEAMMEINDLLSAETKRELDDFIDEIDDLPPEWKEIFKTKKPLLV